MMNIRPTAALCLFALAALGLQADILTGNGSLQTWDPSVLGTGSGPYWNTNVSGDGSNYNIGWCMTGTGNCHIANPPGSISYFGNGTAAASNMSFWGNGSAQAVTLSGTFSNQNGVPPSGTDIFGWYLYANGTLSTYSLFDSNTAIGTSVVFTPTSSYGFYLENVQSAGLPYEADSFFFMNDSLDSVSGPGAGAPEPATQHFSVFSAGSGSYFLGMEDTPASTADFDYNDMVVELQPAPAPEPGSLGLLLSGIGFVGWRLRRARRNADTSPRSLL